MYSDQNSVVLDSDDSDLCPSVDIAWMPESVSVDQQRIGRALFLLQQWLIEMHRRNFAHADDEGVVHLNAEVSARFALGLPVNQTAFVVMPDLEAGWASLIPWDYAAMREGEPSLYLVTHPLTIDGVETPDFGISFHIPDFAKAQALSTRETLQLRRYKETVRGWSVDPVHFAEMPLKLLSSKAPVMGRSQKPKPTKTGGKR